MVLQISISMSRPRGLGDTQGGFFLGWILAQGGVDLPANPSCPKLEGLALVDKEISVSEKRPGNKRASR